MQTNYIYCGCRRMGSNSSKNPSDLLRKKHHKAIVSYGPDPRECMTRGSLVKVSGGPTDVDELEDEWCLGVKSRNLRILCLILSGNSFLFAFHAQVDVKRFELLELGIAILSYYNLFILILVMEN